MFFFFNDTATTEIYTLSLHDALPISGLVFLTNDGDLAAEMLKRWGELEQVYLVKVKDRKSTRLNSSHSQISYAVFCLKKKNNEEDDHMFGSWTSRTLSVRVDVIEHSH